MRNWFSCLLAGHIWVHQFDCKVFEDNRSVRPLYVKRVYVCSRCLKSKKVKL